MVIKLKKRLFRIDCIDRHKINEDHRDWHSRVSSNFLIGSQTPLSPMCITRIRVIYAFERFMQCNRFAYIANFWIWTAKARKCKIRQSLSRGK